MSADEHDELDEETEETGPGWSGWTRTLAEWLGTLLAIAVVWVGVGIWRAPDLPDQAPGFALLNLKGETVSLADLQGRPVVLNFWAEWCGPCRAEIPTLSRFARNHPEVAVLGVAVDGSPTELRRAAQQLGIDYPVLIADDAIKARYGVEILPTTVIIGPDGAVRTAHTGIILGPQLRWAAR